MFSAHWIWLLIAGCSGGDVAPADDSNYSGEPSVELDPTSLEFGALTAEGREEGRISIHKIGFTPKVPGEITAVFEVTSDAVNAPLISADVVGLFGELEVAPAPLDFEAVDLGCEARGSVTISNQRRRHRRGAAPR